MIAVAEACLFRNLIYAQNSFQQQFSGKFHSFAHNILLGR